jgi:ABC-type multidrug transport system fused ATPase/permease subunit
MNDRLRNEAMIRGTDPQVPKVVQKQQIGIARVFLKNPPVLLLDKPTSTLDPVTEHTVLEVIAELMQRKTTIMKTNRIPTIHHPDQIMMLPEGENAKIDDRAALPTNDGLYAVFYRVAQGGKRRAE